MLFRSVLDLDSLALLSNARAVGGAVVSWLIDRPGPDGTVSLEDLQRTADIYWLVRECPRGADAERVFRASVVWNLAYLARCELSVGRPSTAVATLRRLGEQLLA